MAFFSKLKHAFGFNENGDDLDDELDYDLAKAPYVNPFHREQTADKAAQHRRADPEEPARQPNPAPEPQGTPAGIATERTHSSEPNDAEHRVQVAQHRANMLAQRVADMENAMRKQETELTRALEETRTTHQREIKAMQDALGKAKADVAHSVKAEKSWQEKLDAQRAQIDASWQEKLDAQRAQIDASWQEKLDAQRAQIDASWQEKLDTQQAQIDTSWQEKLDAQQAQIDASWQEKLATQRALVQALQERNEQLVRERNKVEAETQQRIDEAIAQADVRVTASQAELAQLRKEIDEQEAQHSSEASRQRNTISDLNNRINDLKRQMATAASLADDYREQMSTMRKEASAATGKHEDLLSEIEEYKQLLHQSQAAEMTALDEQERLKKETDRAWRARNDAQAKLEALQREHDGITGKLKDEYETQLQALTSQLAQAGQELEQLRTQANLDRQQLAQNAIRIEALEATDEAKTLRMKQMEDELSASEKQVEKLTKQSKKHTDIAAQHVDATRQLDATRQELDRQNKLYVAAQGEIQQLSNDLALAQAELATLNRKLEDVAAQASKADAQAPIQPPVAAETIISFVADDDEVEHTPGDTEPEIESEKPQEPQPQPQEPSEIVEPDAAPQELQPQESQPQEPMPQESQPQEPEKEPAPIVHSPSLDDIDDLDWLMPAEPDELPAPSDDSDTQPQAETPPEKSTNADPRQLSLF